ncbi:MAG: alpha/beta fold hydrolase [Myxococcaceae bacterium]
MSRLRNLFTLPSRRPKVAPSAYDVVFHENKTRLLRYRGQERRYRLPVLLVPSMINRHYVLDLMPGKSLVEYLTAQGHDVFCLDWGTPGPEDRYLTFDELVDGYLGRAIRQTARIAGAPQAHVLGYCMGGTLAAIHASVRPSHVASLTTLAAPVSFADGGLLAFWTRSQGYDVNALVAAFGNAPWPLLQFSFHLLRPTLNLAKLVTLIDRAESDEFIDGFLALEHWGNDNVSLPGAFYKRYVEELYRADALLNGTFTLSGQPARLENVRCPLHVVSFERDSIVPKAAALPLLELAGSADKRHLHLNGGHVGAVVSKHAAKSLWPHLSAFWAERDARGFRVHSIGA